jgi:tetratricopeptide (TPR) repeat protein
MTKKTIEHVAALAGSYQRNITAALGYVELGMFLDANEELEKIDTCHRDLPEVLVIRLQIYRALEKWALMQLVARRLAVNEPDKVQWTVLWAYATRRAESIEAAQRILLEAVERIPKAAIFHYNLACYECQRGDVEVAKARLQHAFNLDPKFRLKALEDEDLQPLWGTLAP